MKRLIIGALAMAAASLVGMAHATYVLQNTSSGDSRFTMTGCSYASSCSDKVSFGLWVKDVQVDKITGVCCLGGNGHVNSGHNISGFTVFANSSRWGFSLVGTKADGTYVKHQYVAADGGVDWCTDGNWHFIMFTADCQSAKKARLYLDGVCKKEQTIDASMVSFAGARGLSFGGGMSSDKSDTSSPSRENYGAGVLCLYTEASIYDCQLSDAQVLSLASRRADPMDDHLVGYWPCNESSGNAENWAFHSARRTDGSFVMAMPFAATRIDDADILPFDHPAGLYAVPADFALQQGYVMPANSPMSSLGRPATNLVDAFKALSANKTLRLLPGTYYPAAGLTNTLANVTLTSYDPETGKPDRTGTVIDGSRCTSPQMFYENASQLKPTIRDLTFRDGSRVFYFTGSGPFYVYNCTFTNIVRASGGGTLYSWTRNKAVVSNCLFQACKGSGSGGAIYTIQNAQRSETDYLTITHCRFEDCEAKGTGEQRGGAIYADRHIEIYDCTFVGCHAITLTKNTAYGGALRAGGCSTVLRCTFTDCYVQTPGNAYAQALGTDCPMTMKDCVIETPGLKAYKGAFGLIHIGAYGGGLVENVVCTNNAAKQPVFIFAEGSARSATIRDCLVGSGGAGTGPEGFMRGHVTTAPLIAENCTADVPNIYGGSSDYSSAIFVNCLTRGTFYSSANHTVYLTNCVVSVASGWTGGENIWQRSDLDVVDASHFNYTLTRSAFARDKGVKLDWMTDTSLDLARNPRLVNRQGVAYAPNALPDLGCYECQQPVRGLLCIFR